MKTYISYLNESIRTPHEIAHSIAQYNASLPLSKGGLGLHSNNTAHERAHAMGYDIKNPRYRGMTVAHSDTYKQPYIWTTPEPSHAEEYSYNDLDSQSNILKVFVKHSSPVHLGYRSSAVATPFNDIKDRVKQRILDAYQNKQTDIDTAKKAFNTVNTLPNKDGHKKVWVWRESTPEFKDALASVGYDSLHDTEGNEREEYNTLGLFHPHQVKSVHAAFDPMNIHGGLLS